MADRNMAPNGENLNGIVEAGGPLTMSSREIAELTGKEHRNVLADIRKMLVDLVGEEGVLKFQHTHVNEQNGQSYPIFRLPKRECLILVSGYSVELRARIIDRWMELEQRERDRPAIDPMQVLNDPGAMRGLLLTYTEKVLPLQAENRALGEKAEALDRIAMADGSMCLTDAAKHLQVRPKDLIAYLSQHGWIYRRPGGGHWIGYQSRIGSGDLEHKVNTVLHANGEERVHEQVRVTTRGLTKLAKLVKPVVQAA